MFKTAQKIANKVGPHKKGYKEGLNSSTRGYDPSYPFIRPLIGVVVITPFINL